MKAILLSLLLATIATALFTSCNTLRGAGRDMQNLGTAVSRMGN